MRAPRRVWTALVCVGVSFVVSVSTAQHQHLHHNGSRSQNNSTNSFHPGGDVFAGDASTALGVPSFSALLAELTGDDAGAAQRPAWLAKPTVLGALTSSLQAEPSNGDVLVDGIVVRIAPRFVVTTASLLSARGLARLRDASVSTRAVVFHGGSAQVTRVAFESDFYGGPSGYPLVVLELGEEPAGTSPLTRVVTSSPNKGFEFEQLRLLQAGALLDSKAVLAHGVAGREVNDVPVEQSKLTFFVEPMCGFQIPRAADSITELCVGQLTRTTGTSYFDSGNWPRGRHLERTDDLTKSSPSNLNASIPSIPWNHWNASSGVGLDTNGSRDAVGAPAPIATAVASTGMEGARFSPAAVLLYGNDVVGLSIPTMTVPKRFQTPLDSKIGFLRLAAPDHLAFLEDATRHTVQFQDDDVFSKQSKYPSYLATFLDARGAKLSCQGVLIAPKFVLTTASCLAAEPGLSAVQFYAADPAQRETVAIASGHMAPHPRYTKGSVTYDTAVIALERAVAFAPIQLDDGSTDDSASFARLEVADDDACVISATVASHDADVCHGDKLRAGAAFCVVSVAANASASATPFSAKSFVGDDAIAKVVDAQPASARGAALVAVTKHSTVALVGLAVQCGSNSTRSSSSSHRRGLETTTSQGEVYVRVANSATFINAYVTGTSWTGGTAKILLVDEGTQGVADGGSGADSEGDVALAAGEQFVVGLRTTQDGQNYCGGSLIGPTAVLTAAHCVVDGPARFVSIGGYSSSGDAAEVIAVVPEKTQIHTRYGSPHAFSFDVAVLELAYASAARPVLLDDTADFTAREPATMYGYGMSSATSGLSPTLRAVGMPLWSRAACAQVFGSAVDDSMLCAGGEKGKDACAGDSGSPLVITRSGRNVLVGVVSAGSGCGLENVPGLYARLHSVRDFVSSHAIGADWDTSGGASGGVGNNNQAGSKGGGNGATTSPSAIEAREAGNSSSSSTAAKGTTTATTTTTTSSPATGPYNVATVALAELSPLVAASLMDFLLGADAERVMGTAAVAAISQRDNVLQLYSTDALTALLAVVARHDALPLNQRRDRFAMWRRRATAASDSGDRTSSSVACAA